MELFSYMMIALSNTNMGLSFDGVLVVVLAFNLIVLLTMTFAPQVHNKISTWIFDTFFDGSHNSQK